MELTYGEVTFSHFIPILEFADPKPGEVFWDLGCGAGRPLISASLAFPELKACKGLELLGQLASLGSHLATRLHDSCTQREVSFSPMEVWEGDILNYDWFDADLIYLSAVCFSEELCIKVADLLTRVKKGTRILSLRPIPERDYLEMFSTIEAKMSWGQGRIYYYRVV